MKLLLRGASDESDVDWNHRWSFAQTPADGGDAILRECSDGAASRDDFRGIHGGSERCDYVCARERHGNVAEGKDGMPTGEDFAVVHGGDGAAGADRKVAAN